jgi:hypothetical protein
MKSNKGFSKCLALKAQVVKRPLRRVIYLIHVQKKVFQFLGKGHAVPLDPLRDYL